jgi:hypothetical protein
LDRAGCRLAQWKKTEKRTFAKFLNIMKSFEHRYVLCFSILSIDLPERTLLPVLKILHKLFPNKKWFIKIK